MNRRSVGPRGKYWEKITVVTLRTILTLSIAMHVHQNRSRVEVRAVGIWIKDRLAIATRSLKDRSVTIVSLTQVLVSCVVGVWLVELPSSSIMYWKVPRLIVKKTNRLTQAVAFFRRHFLCGALLW